MLALALVGGTEPLSSWCRRPAWLVHAAAAATVALIVLAFWRARGAHGAREQLPAGRQPPLSVRPWLDADFFLKASRRYGPVFKTRQFLRPMVCIVGLPPGRALLRDHDTDLDAPPMAFDRLVEGGYINFRDRSDHDDVKTVFGPPSPGRPSTGCVPMLRNGMHHGLAAAAAGPRPVSTLVRRSISCSYRSGFELFFGLRPRLPNGSAAGALRRPRHSQAGCDAGATASGCDRGGERATAGSSSSSTRHRDRPTNIPSWRRFTGSVARCSTARRSPSTCCSS